MAISLSIEQVLAIMPHRSPFVLIDRVLSLDPMPQGTCVGRKIHAIKGVTYNEPFFPGHFPGKPLMPGVLMIEALAQASMFLAPLAGKGMKSEVMIAGVDNARFRAPVIPGDQLNLYSEVMKERSGLFFFKCHGKVDGKVVVEADIMAKQFIVSES